MIQFSGNISKNFTQREYHPGTTTVYYTVNTSTFVRCLQQFRNWLKRPMIVVSFFRKIILLNRHLHRVFNMFINRLFNNPFYNLFNWIFD